MSNPEWAVFRDLLKAQDWQAGRRLVVAARAEGWRVGLQRARYSGEWSKGPEGMAMIPTTWDVTTWLGTPHRSLVTASRAASALRGEIFEMFVAVGFKTMEMDEEQLLPITLQMGAGDGRGR